MHNSNQEKYEHIYRELPLLQRELLRIIAIGFDNSFSKTSLLKCFSALSLRKEDKTAWKIAEVREAFANLQDRELVHTETSRLFLAGHLRMAALLDSLNQPWFAARARVINDFLNPHDLNSDLLLGLKMPDLLRNIQVGILTGEAEERVRPFLDAAIEFFLFGYGMHPLQSLFLNPYRPEILPHIVATGSVTAVALLLQEIAENILPLEGTGELGRLLASDGCRPETRIGIVMNLLFCGRNDLVETYLEDPALADCDLLPLQTLLAVFTGRTSEALAGFDQWTGNLRRKNRKRFVLLPGLAQFLFLCTLLRSGDGERLNQGMDAINRHRRSLASQRVPSDVFLCLAMQEVFADLMGQTLRPADRMVDLEIHARQMTLSNLLHAMILSWTRPKAARKHIDLLNSILDQATASQNLWLVAETANILAHLGVAKRANTEIVREIRQASGLACLSDSCPRLERWQKTLLALQALARSSADKDNRPDSQRLVWLLTPAKDPERVFLGPRLQKLRKNGRWTKGRTVALKTLFEQADSMEGLSDLDRSLASLISVRRETDYHNYRARTVYTLDPVKALPLLARHPLVFLAESPTTRVDIVPARPRLDIRHDKGRVHLELVPPAKDLSRHGALVRETPTRYAFYRLDSGQQRLYQVLERPLTLPDKAADTLLSSISSLSSLVTIQSDIDPDGADVPREQGDPTPHLHLLPVGQGLQAEFLVRPLPGSDTWCSPGQGGESMVLRADGRPVTVVRDLARERELCEQVIRACPTLERLEPVDGHFQIDDPGECLELLLELGKLGDAVVLEWPRGEKFRVRGESSFDRLSLRLKKDRDWFAATGRLQVDSELALDLKQLLQLLESSQGRFVRLDDGSFLALTREFRRRVDELRAYGEFHGKGVRIPPLASLALDELTEQAGSLSADQAWKKHVARLRQPVNPEIPSTLQARLRSYQVEGFAWLARLSHWGVGACLADDMGLGKTVQALAAVLLRAPAGPSLVVAPVSVIANWEEEARRFAPTLQVRHFGPGDRDACLSDLGPFDLVLCSYGLLPTEIDRLAKVSWQTVILDEAQAIKNHQTRRARAALRLKAAFRLATTGTPLENNLSELWSLFRFLNPGLLGSRKSFHERFVQPIEGDQDREARQRLRRLIRPFLLRRVKSEVLQELPPRTDITLEVVMSPEEAALYEASRQAALERLAATDDGEGGSRHLRILAEITRLRRLCCNPRLLDPESRIPSSKLKVFGDTLAELLAGGHKALVFSQFVDHLRIIREYLEKEKINYQYLDGQTSRRQREARVKAFQAGEGEVFLISLKAGGTGLNLTAADYVIHMDPWWNPAVEDQASDRAHRIGQDRPVTVYRLITRGTIEEQIVSLHREKRDLADSLLSGADISARLSAEELLQLLRQDSERNSSQDL